MVFIPRLGGYAPPTGGGGGSTAGIQVGRAPTSTPAPIQPRAAAPSASPSGYLPPPAPSVPSGGDGGGGGGGGYSVNQTYNTTYGSMTAPTSPASSPSSGGVDAASMLALLAASKQNLETQAPGWEGMQQLGQVAPGLGQRTPPQSIRSLTSRVY